jgi:nicotinamidase-related amidase
MERFHINAQNAALLVIDIQNNLAVAMKKDIYATVEKNTCILISSAIAMNLPIIVTEQYRKGLGSTVEPIISALGERYQPVEKLHFSCWHEPEIHQKLTTLGKKYIIVAGIESHVCVLQTALDLISNGYHVHVVSDAVCSRYKSDWKSAMQHLRQAGAVVTTTEIVTFQLLHKAGSPEFKVISPLFKNR